MATPDVVTLVKSFTAGNNFIMHKKGKIAQLVTFTQNGLPLGLLANNDVADPTIGFKVYSDINYYNVTVTMQFI